GTGLLISINVSLSMLAATLVVLVTGPMLIDDGIGREIVLSNIAETHRPRAEALIDKKWADLTEGEQKFVEQQGGREKAYMKQDYFGIRLAWYMWPATGLMIAAAITAVLLQWRLIVESFRQLRQAGHPPSNPPNGLMTEDHYWKERVQTPYRGREDVSLTTVVMGALLLTAALAVVQQYFFQMSYVQTALAVLCSLPLILVGIRVLGETNNGPISVMMNGL